MCIALLHGALVAAASGAALAAGWPVRGVALGGSIMGASLVLLWAMARFTLAGRKLALAVLASVKILLYGSLLAAVLTGWLVADGEGFAVGITCFVVATLVVTVLAGRRTEIA